MSGRNIEDFFDDAQAFDALSEEDKARLIAGESLEGDTDADPAVAGETEDSGASSDATDTTNQEAVAESDPVVLAKDGKHTIPFSELESARERARQLEQELQSLRSATPPAAEQSEAQVVDKNAELLALIKEQNEALIMTDTDKAAEIGMRILAIQQEVSDQRAMAAMDAREAQRVEKETLDSVALDAQSKANALVEKYPFLKPESPTTNQDAIDLVIAQRDRLMSQGVSFADAIEQAVAKVAPLFSPSTTKTAPTDVAAKAAEVISKAKSQVPTSLSQVPAGAAAHHDEGEAIRNDTGLSLMARFQGKSPEEIERIISRVI